MAAKRTDSNSAVESSKTQTGENVTISKSTLLVAVIGVLALLLILSLATGGFGLGKGTTAPGTGGTAAAGTGGSTPSPSPSPGGSAGGSGSTAPRELQTIQLSGGSLPALGQANAPVALIEFSDFQCPYCGRHYDQTESSITQNYVDTGKVKFYYRDYPLLQLGHRNADDTAFAARCANDQSKFWEYHDKLFENQQAWSGLGDDAITATLVEYAGDLGLDTAAFETCLSSQQHADAVTQDVSDGQAAYGGPLGTPTFFILIPKDKTSVAQLEAAMGQYARYMGLAQTDDEYVVMVTGALPYSVFKAVFDTVSY